MSELPITDPPRWSVRTKYHSQSREEKSRKIEPVVKHHELTFGGTVHEKGKGEGELGWACGQGKQTLVLTCDGQEPELMAKMCDHICTSLQEAVDILAR